MPPRIWAGNPCLSPRRQEEETEGKEEEKKEKEQTKVRNVKKNTTDKT